MCSQAADGGAYCGCSTLIPKFLASSACRRDKGPVHRGIQPLPPSSAVFQRSDVSAVLLGDVFLPDTPVFPSAQQCRELNCLLCTAGSTTLSVNLAVVFWGLLWKDIRTDLRMEWRT